MSGIHCPFWLFLFTAMWLTLSRAVVQEAGTEEIIATYLLDRWLMTSLLSSSSFLIGAL